MNALTPTCPSREELAALSLGTLSADAWQAVADHVQSCDECSSVLEALPDQADDLVDSLRDLKESASVTIPGAVEAAMQGLDAQALLGGDVRRSDAVAQDLPPGTHLREYRLLERIGEGGMGTVYRAVHTRLDRLVALKVLLTERMNKPESLVRFQREMKAVGKINHPNVVQATDAGEVDGTHFLVMELVEGTDLARLVRRRGPLGIADACEVIRQAALGLQNIHSHGLIHRDIKPSNLILAAGGAVKILDLGLALLQKRVDASEGATTSGLVMGSFDYMAPEQADDPHAVDARADLYSLGCSLYYLLTGAPPFPAPQYQTPLQKMKAHAATVPPRLQQQRPEAPKALADLLGRLLAKAPAQRPANATEVAEALEPFAAGADLCELARAAADQSPTAGDWHNPERARPAAPPRKRSRLVWLVVWLAAALLLSLVGALAGLILYVQTDTGLLTIQSDDPDIKVSIEQEGGVVTILDLKTNKQVTLKSGEYHLKLVDKGKELELTSNRFTLKRGDKEVVTIRRMPRPASAAGKPTATLQGHRGWIYSLAFSPDGNWLASGSGDKTIHLWDARTGTLKQSFPEGPGKVYCVRFSPDGRKLASCGLNDECIYLWEVPTGQRLATLKWFKTGKWDLAFSPEGDSLAVGCQDGTCRLWDLAQDRQRDVLPGGKDHVRRVLFFPKDKILATAGSAIHLWDLEKKKQKLSLPHLQTSALALSPDSRLLAAGHWGKGVITIFDTANGKPLRSWKAHNANLNDLAFAPNGQVLASSSHDGTVRLWDPNTGDERAAFKGHKGPVDAIAFSPDGKTLASGGIQDFQILCWDTNGFVQERPAHLQAHP